MKSLEELLFYYDGAHMGARATSRLSFPPGKGPVHLSDSGRRLDAALLYDADRLTKASLVSYLASSRLRSGGFGTWGAISLYYARFHSISAMLRLVGVAVNGQRLLLHTDESCREYLLVDRNAPQARAIGCGGGSHREQWRMFSRCFHDWTQDEPPGTAASVLGEEPISVSGTAWYEAEIDERNEANYLKSNDGVFFPETDFSGMQGVYMQDAKLLGNWDYLRTDASPYGDDDPPESHLFKEMMAWDLIKFIILALARLQGQSLLDEYLWLLEKLEAHDELRRHMRADLGGAL